MSKAAAAALKRTALLAVLAAALAACGQTGALYLPGEEVAAGGTTLPADEAEDEQADEERGSP